MPKPRVVIVGLPDATERKLRLIRECIDTVIEDVDLGESDVVSIDSDEVKQYPRPLSSAMDGEITEKDYKDWMAGEFGLDHDGGDI